MTECCINNGSSKCQTVDATHLVLVYEDYGPNRTIGQTYFGDKVELLLHFVTDPDAISNCLAISVTNTTQTERHILVYDDPYDHTSLTKLVALPAKEDVQIYVIREVGFNYTAKLIVFLRFVDKYMNAEEIYFCERIRLWKSLQQLTQDPVYADVTVFDGKGHQVEAHRAVLAAASKVLDCRIESIERNNHFQDTDSYITNCNEHTDLKEINTNGVSVQSINSDLHHDDFINVVESFRAIDVSDNINTILDNGKKDKQANPIIFGKSTEKRNSCYNIIESANNSDTLTVSSKISSGCLSGETAKEEKHGKDYFEVIVKKLPQNFHSILFDLNDYICNATGNHINEAEFFKEYLQSQVDSLINDPLIGNQPPCLPMEKPSPNNYTFIVHILKSQNCFSLFIKYIYCGSIGDIEIKEDLHDVDDLLSVAYSCDQYGLIKQLESAIIRGISEYTVVKAFQIANNFNLENLKSETVSFCRRFRFCSISEDIKNNMLLKYIIFKPLPFQQQKAQRISLSVFAEYYEDPGIFQSFSSVVFFINDLKLQISGKSSDGCLIIYLQAKDASVNVTPDFSIRCETAFVSANGNNIFSSVIKESILLSPSNRMVVLKEKKVNALVDKSLGYLDSHDDLKILFTVECEIPNKQIKKYNITKSF